ncbi:MAG: tryptophan 2,3-dioxygenase [Deltaproteobacteria bacterium]|nr:MAG: tryptophan 2,3-dioxygenase [Deltaproteobacteria bacterium]
MEKPYPPIYYADYLALEEILSAQHPKSEAYGRPAHDEMLFIVVHQAYELWFKQILHELTSVIELLGRDYVDESDVGIAVARLGRIVAIQKLIVGQLDVLETMTPLDFLDFRDFLLPASGFQSVQFRLIENRLGLEPQMRTNFHSGSYAATLKPEDRRRLEAAEREPSLFETLERWLERTPFLDLEGFNFMERYRQAVSRMLEADRRTIEQHPHLSEEERITQLSEFARTEENFAALFDEGKHEELVKQGRRRLSYRATLAALFIHLYRDQPILHLPFRLLTTVIDIDEQLTTWRYRHALMVHRMIGTKIGTGGSSGHHYLKETAEKHKIFTDLLDLSTFLIPRSSLPELPADVRRKLGFFFTGEGR